MAAPPRWAALCTLQPGPGPPRFLCFCEEEPGEEERGEEERGEEERGEEERGEEERGEEQRGEEQRGEEERGEEELDARGQGCFRLHVTDGARLWSTCFPPARLAALKARCGRSAAEDLAPQFRAAFQRQAVAFTPQGDGASLTLSGGPWPLDFDLSEVPGPEAAPRLQALTLGLAERVCSLERQLAAAEETAASPRKSPRPGGPLPFSPDPDSQRGGPGPGVRRRSPGESLINPGFKSKKPASGVDFDDL